MELAGHDDPKVSYPAARAVVELGLKGIGHLDLEDRVNAVESMLHGQQRVTE